MWRHLANEIEWSDKLQCEMWLLSTQNCTGLWLPNSNSAEIFLQFTYRPSFIILYLLVWKLSCWQANPNTNSANKQTNGENIQRLVITYHIFLHIRWSTYKSTPPTLRANRKAFKIRDPHISRSLHSIVWLTHCPNCLQCSSINTTNNWRLVDCNTSTAEQSRPHSLIEVSPDNRFHLTDDIP